MEKKELRAFAPASIANLACGYDIFGLAFDALGDEVSASFSKGGVSISSIEGDEGLLSYDPKKNCIGVVAQAFLDYISAKEGVLLSLKKGMPLSSGLGSSAASSVAAGFVINELFDRPLGSLELLSLIVEGERLACEARHFDNVAPSLLGGFTVVRKSFPLDVFSVNLNLELFAAVVYPAVCIHTKDARELLPKNISLEIFARQAGNVAALIAACSEGSYDLLASSLQDFIAEPYRSSLIPSYDKAKEAALRAGALGVNISGSGPSVFALCKSEELALAAAKALSEHLPKPNQSYIASLPSKGARLL